MKDCDSSHSGSEDFTHTKDYEEATQLLHFGFSDVVPKIKEQLQTCKYDHKEMTKKPRQQNGMVGYAPNVPNAIQGKIDNMICTEKTPTKKKTLSIVYLIGANCDKDTSYFIKAGTALIAAVQSIEKLGVQVKLQECFFSAKHGSNRVYSLLNIKNYGHRFDLKKITFPIAHPSMFRRFGFKWLETVPGLTDHGFAWGYGQAINDHHTEVVDLQNNLSKDTVAINVYQIEKMHFSVDKIIEYLNSENKKITNGSKKKDRK